jgi:hypothetical protein
MCIFGLHGAREIDYTNDHKEICVCQRVNRTGFVGDFLFKLGHLT